MHTAENLRYQQIGPEIKDKLMFKTTKKYGAEQLAIQMLSCLYAKRIRTKEDQIEIDILNASIRK